MKRAHAIATHEKLLSHAKGNRVYTPEQRELFLKTARVIADLGYEAEAEPSLSAKARTSLPPRATGEKGAVKSEEAPSVRGTRTSPPPGAGESGKGPAKGKGQ